MRRDAARYGLADAEFEAVLAADGRRPFSRFERHKLNAQRRGVEFRLTFAEWWDVWTRSGCYGRMGPRRDQYVMARIRDSGPYAVWNVQIQTARTNGLDAVESRGRRRVRIPSGARSSMVGGRSMYGYATTDALRENPLDALDDYCSPNFGALARRSRGG